MHQLIKRYEEIILGTARIRLVGKNGNECITRALCDNGSQVNLITQVTILKLGEKPSFEKTTFQGVGGNSLGSSLGEVNLKMKLKNGNLLKQKFYVVKNITNYHPLATNHEWEYLKGNLADEQYNKEGKIHVLLGAGVWIEIIESGIIKSENAVAHQTKLGYIILENNENPYEKETPYIGQITKGPSIKNLMNIMQKLWEIEEIQGIKTRTKEEQLCEDIFVEHHYRMRGKYIVRMPFNHKIRELGKSKKMALSQFFAMENKMKKNREFAEKYKNFISEYESLGHMTKLWEEKERGYYTPHHGIMSSKKFRVVFNASAKTTSGITLNEAQLVGEKLQKDLPDLLINFRTFRIGITADIEKMYRQVWIDEQDKQYQKILWRYNETDPIQVYQLNTVTYGQACAPHCAIRSLVQCGIDNEKKNPEAAKIIKNDFYVDDLLTGSEDMKEAEKIKREVTETLKDGGFHITKWRTNGTREHLEFKETDQPSVLGLFWDLEKDKFFYKIQSKEEKKQIWTKRKILSKIGKLYDPNGYLGPIIMRGKIIIQELWKNKMNWDEEVKGEIKGKWEEFNKDLENIHLISINRWFGTTKRDKIQIHGFCDASEKGYGAVLFSRIRQGDKFKTEIIASKSRVAPLKTLTIPRLELCAAHLLAKLIKSVIRNFEDKQQKIKIFAWSDSQVVYYWINKPTTISLKIYVANRVNEIQEINNKFNIQWRWISTKENPADLISRGSTIINLKNELKWWHGPFWLHDINQNWPEQPKFYGMENLNQKYLKDIEKELKIKTILLTKIENDELKKGNFNLIDAYSNLNTLKRVMAYIFRAVKNFKNLKKKNVENLSLNEENEALDYFIRIDQQRSYPEEIKKAKNGSRIIYKGLVLIWDQSNKFLRIDGRVVSKNLTKDEQFPILLDKEGAIVKLLVKDAHMQNNGHNATQWILQYLRKRYWVIALRNFVKGTLRKCPRCFRLKMKESNQLMSTLPNFRTTPQRAFSTTGIDYAGPVKIRFNLGRNPRTTKAWIAVFVCTVTRAIHLELVSDASTQAFIAALRRMIARRGQIRQIISDNGTNFVGANNFLKEINTRLTEEDSNSIERNCNIKWIFTTPGAPHMGGIYESAVKTVKFHLIRIIGETLLTFEEYSTVLAQVEALVNSRPLCALNDDVTSFNALTPAHFLIGESLVQLPDEQDFRNTPMNRLTRWNVVQRITQDFWTRWHNEYIGTLINRKKWLIEQRNFKIDDLIIIKDENLPPLRWKMGRIVQLHTGNDGLVRSITIKTSNGFLKRPVVKIGLLLANNEE